MRKNVGDVGGMTMPSGWLVYEIAPRGLASLWVAGIDVPRRRIVPDPIDERRMRIDARKEQFPVEAQDGIELLRRADVGKLLILRISLIC